MVEAETKTYVKLVCDDEDCNQIAEKTVVKDTFDNNSPDDLIEDLAIEEGWYLDGEEAYCADCAEERGLI